MAAPMTPNSELLYSYLNLDAFNTPGDLYMNADGKNEDVFARAFGAHGNGEIKSKSDLMQNTFVLRHNELNSQYLSATPPPSVGATSNSPATDFPDVTIGQDPAASQIPGYLAHVLSTRRPNNVFSYENQYDPGYTLQPDSTNVIIEKEYILESAAFEGSYRDPAAAIPELPSEVKLDQYNRAQTPHSETSTQPPEPGTASATKVKKTRKRRNLRTAEEEAARHEAFLERNRKAAGKCRSKKKDRVQQLIWDMEASRSMNNQLKAEHWELLDEVAKLRAWALEHTKLAAEGLCTAMEVGTAQSEPRNGVMALDVRVTEEQALRGCQSRDSIPCINTTEAEQDHEGINVDIDLGKASHEFLVDVDMDINNRVLENTEAEEIRDQVHGHEHEQAQRTEKNEQVMKEAESLHERDRVPSLDSSSGTIDSEGPPEEEVDVVMGS